VQRWFQARASMLQQLAYRVQCRRVATDTQEPIDWVKAGRGYRGVMLLTDYKTLHPEPDAAGDVRPEQVQHAVGVTVDRLDAAGDESLVMIDPYPGAAGAKDRCDVHPKIEEAHRGRNFHGLIYYWSGWS